MRRESNRDIEIVSLAQDLGLGAKSNPYLEIVDYCVAQVLSMVKKHGEFSTLTDLLDCAVNEANSTFREIHSDNDLRLIKDEYCSRKEKGFVDLDAQLAGEVFGITYRLGNPEPWENQFVSIIDCRGPKGFRSYFTKWHEVAHLLTITDQGRLVFRRTHSRLVKDVPEEGLMDGIAGRLGFLKEIFHGHLSGRISFAEMERLRRQLCAEASQPASVINFVKYWPEPVIHLEVGPGLNSKELDSLRQNAFDFVDAPEPVLRALHVSCNDAARSSHFQLFDNMRVPETSCVREVYEGRTRGVVSSECFSAWQVAAAKQNISVEARWRGDVVEALLTPN